MARVTGSSHGRTGQCWDNALAESFFGSVKGELLDLQTLPPAPAPAAQS
jgi:putative transposase